MDEETARRVWAAGAYAGYRTAPTLAQALGTSADTLKGRLNGSRPFRPFESEEGWLHDVAKLCGLPYEFFTVDFAALPQLVEDEDLSPRGQEIMKRLYGVIEELRTNIDQFNEPPGITTEAAKDAGLKDLDAELDRQESAPDEEDEDEPGTG